ncbi:MAG: hypothetical protein KGI54_17710 [Pseudomonadota bacterium]|nr:hypothetical protein [Pseudomonadota bacterium]
MANPIVAQGTLNRIRCSIIIPDYSSLNITAAYMGKNFATVTFGSNFTTQVETGTGVVNSPEPYVMTTVAVGILRTQSLSSSWLTQLQDTSVLGNVTIHSDTSAFPAINLVETSVIDYNPGAFDGMDPVVAMTLRGVFYTNNSLWNAV